MATNSYIQVAADGGGKLMQTFVSTISGNSVHAEAVSLVDTNGAYISVLPVSFSGGNINVDAGTVAATQSGTWNIGTLTSVTNPVTAAQNNASNFLATVSQGSGAWYLSAINTAVTAISPNASNFLATVSGTVAATQSGTWNISVTKLQGGASMASGQVSATNVSSTLVSSRATRRSVTCRNLDATNSGYIGSSPVGVTNGMLLLPRESMAVDFVGAIAVITTSGNANFAYLETYD